MTNANLLSWDRNHLLPITLQDWDKTVTFLNVLVQLVDKRVQLLPLLGRKLKCIAGMNPLTQGTAIETEEWKHKKRQLSKPVRGWSEGQQERRVFTSCRCLVRWFPQEQTGRGNPPGRTTAIQSYLYLLIHARGLFISCNPFHKGQLQHHLSWEESTIWTITS